MARAVRSEGVCERGMDSTGPYEPAPAPAPPVPVSDEEKAARVEALRSRVPGLAEVV